MKQRTLQQAVAFHGLGLHTGKEVMVRVCPAEPNTGIVFARVDLDPGLRVRATFEHVQRDETRQTSLVIGTGVVRTIEHLMATFHGLGIDNAVVEVDGEELPGMDGSAKDFADAFLQAGIVEQAEERRWLEITAPIFVDLGDQSIVLMPGPHLSISYTLSYRHEDLNDQFLSITILPEIFERELAPARTFCLKQEAEQLLAQGFGKGANLDNTLVFERNLPVENTLRFPDEACRHKIVDLLGDLYLAGGFIRGHVIATRSGHSLNLELVRKIAMVHKEEPISFPSVLLVEDIQKIIPHRYPFLFVDRIEKFEPGVKATGFKQG
ncbi:MAG: UDP-3-O-acyl-N-acetylglucosamine deacetylase, partial [Candidatus Omnitrophica bacterium]|nr:UDP-3-O-acyl-N-acetylglucosamine deacetylase [Candidatus Omnitrophota bacterium]